MLDASHLRRRLHLAASHAQIHFYTAQAHRPNESKCGRSEGQASSRTIYEVFCPNGLSWLLSVCLTHCDLSLFSTTRAPTRSLVFPPVVGILLFRPRTRERCCSAHQVVGSDTVSFQVVDAQGNAVMALR